MMNFKVRNGFTLTEVLIALLVAGMLLVPLFTLYDSVMQQVFVRSSRIQALLTAKQFLFEARKQAGTEKKFELEQVSESFSARLRYERTTISENYIFAPYQMMKEVVTVSWRQFGTPHREQLVAYMYVPEASEKKNELAGGAS